MDYAAALVTALVVAACLAVYLRLFHFVYARGGGKAGSEQLTWVDMVFATGLVVYIVFQSFAHLSTSSPPRVAQFSGEQLILATLISWGLVLGPILISLRARGIHVGPLFGFDRLSIPRAVAWGIGLLFLALPLVFGSSALVTEWLKTRAGQGSQEIIQIFRDSTQASQRVSIILLAVVIAPVAEELVFRGYLYSVLKRFFGALPSLVFNGVLFGLVHVNVPALVPLFLLGCTFTIAYEVTGSLFVPMTMHALFNAINLVAVLLFPHDVG
ncbi:MAG: CPBP family intramembrane metalloprotease [Verrucomicrobia bacterium]|nr:CPBP family intramembrane metalloprotease [Verrucomicrobiota bacterium]